MKSSTALLKMRNLTTRNSTQHCRLPTSFTLREAHVKRTALTEFDQAARCRTDSNRQINHHRPALLRLRLSADPYVCRVLIDVLDSPRKGLLARTLDMQRRHNSCISSYSGPIKPAPRPPDEEQTVAHAGATYEHPRQSPFQR